MNLLPFEGLSFKGLKIVCSVEEKGQAGLVIISVIEEMFRGKWLSVMLNNNCGEILSTQAWQQQLDSLFLGRRTGGNSVGNQFHWLSYIKEPSSQNI